MLRVALTAFAACACLARAAETCESCKLPAGTTDSAVDDSSLLSRKMAIHAKQGSASTSAASNMAPSLLNTDGPRRQVLGKHEPAELGGPWNEAQTRANEKLAACLSSSIPDADMALTLQAMMRFNNLKRWLLHNVRAQVTTKPLAVVFPNNTEEVSKAVTCAVVAGVQVKASSGRHSYVGFCNPCLLLNMYHLKCVHVRAKTDTAVLGAGLNLGQAYTLLADHGYTIPGGTCPTVGLSGLALGGGKGVLVRQYGLLSDQVYGIDAVLQNGSTVHANATQHEDLLWMAKGGGGDVFPGIVTAFHFNLVKVPPVVTEYHVVWNDCWVTVGGSANFGRGEGVVKMWQDRYVSHPDWRVYARLTMYPYARQITIDFKFIGMTREEAEAIVPMPSTQKNYSSDEMVYAPDDASWGDLNKTYLESVQEGGGIGVDFTSQGCSPWPQNMSKEEREARARKEMLNEFPPFCSYDSSFDTHMLYRSLVISRMSDEAIHEFVMQVANAPYFDSRNQSKWQNNSWHFYLQIDPTSGYAGTIAPEATPYPHRGPTEMTLQVIAKWSDREAKGAGLTEMGGSMPTFYAFNYLLVARLQPYVGTRAYYNYLDNDMPGGVVPGEAYFGKNLERLRAIRKRYQDQRLPLEPTLVNNYCFVRRDDGPITPRSMEPWMLRRTRANTVASVQADDEDE